MIDDDLSNALKTEELEYARRWVSEALEWQRFGLYQTIAELMDPKDEHTVVDAGCGPGSGLIALHQANSKAAIIGVERSSQMASIAMTVLLKLNIPVCVHINQYLRRSTDGNMAYNDYVIPSAGDIKKLQDASHGAVTVLCDDMRYPGLTQRILEDELIDGVTLCMPGGSTVRGFEWPHNAREATNQEVLARRCAESTDQFRLGTAHFASKHTKPGGKLIIAERMALEDDENERIWHILAEKMGVNKKYWDATSFRRTGRSVQEARREVAWVAIDGTTVTQAETYVRERGISIDCGVYELHRNRRQFDEAALPSPHGK